MKHGAERLHLPEGVAHVLVALSGGADSVYLLHAMLEAGAQVSAAHYHHGLRAEADDDLAFCRTLCEGLRVPLYTGRGDVKTYAREAGLGVETAARELRYRFLRETMSVCGADVIALAHHRNDQAETVLMHLLRGSGLRGAGGMAVLEGDLYRPLLDTGKADITASLTERGIPWREDATNAVNDNPRNTIRNAVMPQLTEFYPGCDAALARFAGIAREEDAFLEQMTAEAAKGIVTRLPGMIRLDAPAALPDVLLRRLLIRLTGIRDSRDAARMLDIVKSVGKRTDFGRIILEPHGERLYIIERYFSASGEAEFCPDGSTVLPGLCRLQSHASEPVPVRDNGLHQVLNREALQGCVLRTRRKGDRITPLGAPGSRLLSDFLTDKKIPRPERDILPLLARGSEVLWAAGAGIAEAAKVRDGVSAVAITCSYITHEEEGFRQ